MSNLTELSQRLFSIRHTGSHGTPIKMHRALRNEPFTAATLLSIMVLPVFFDIVLWFNLDNILQWWGQVFAFWVPLVSPEGGVGYIDTQLFETNFVIAFPNLPVALITAHTALLNALVCIFLFVISFLASGRMVPLVTLLRAALMIQISASLYRFFNHYGFPYDLAGYMNAMIGLGAYLLFITSPILALVYYIFNFSLLKKILVTAGTIVYFMVLVPQLYLLHALIISNFGLLFMPLLYLLFGPLLITLMFVSIYSWVMTHKTLS